MLRSIGPLAHARGTVTPLAIRSGPLTAWQRGSAN